MGIPSDMSVTAAFDRPPGPDHTAHAGDKARYLHHGGHDWSLALTALGIVFGDIGTSPLYTFSVALSRTGHTVPTAMDVLGITSLILWALMLMVSLKYVVFVLRADNDGEGGILALLSLVRPNRHSGSNALPLLVVLGILGAALLYGDGVITPAISVLSAMEGLKLAAPGFAAAVVPVTLVILVILFAVQRKGTASIGRLFGPVMLAWFLVIGVLGIINICAVPQILWAVDPSAAARLIGTDPVLAFAVFGAVFLALTGGEALYADMGHVGAPAIRRAWFGLVLPCLLLNYFGQGALILGNPAAIDNPFYKLAPDWALLPMILLAAAATVIASQALISGVFSLTQQAMQMGFCPRARIIPTSSDAAGQIYVPAANWLLMIGTLAIVASFRTSDNLAAAYGIAVSGTMLITTVLLSRAMIVLWHWPIPVVAVITLLFGSVDAIFLAANSLKIFQGGWLPLVVSAVIVGLMLCWRKGDREVRRHLEEMSMPLADFIAHVDEQVIGRAPGVGVWLTKVEAGASPMMLHHVRHDRVLHETVILLTVVPERRPRVPFAERHEVHRLGHGSGFYRVVVKLGFMQTPDIPLTLRNCGLLGFDVDLANAHYYVGHEVVVRRAAGSAFGPFFFGVFAAMTKLGGRAPDFYRLPQAELTEIGFRVEI
jgi:KUP system potassium uptake protein